MGAYLNIFYLSLYHPYPKKATPTIFQVSPEAVRLTFKLVQTKGPPTLAWMKKNSTLKTLKTLKAPTMRIKEKQQMDEDEEKEQNDHNEQNDNQLESPEVIQEGSDHPPIR